MRRRDFISGLLAATAAAKAVPANAFAAQQQATPAATAATQTPVAGQTIIPSTPAPAPGPVPWMDGLLEAKPLDLNTLVPDAVAQTDAHFFNGTQTQTLRRLCEVLMPRIKAYPSAVDVGVPEFLDFLIGVSPRQQQQMYTAGLDKLDADSRHKSAVPFAQTSAAQADAVIRPWLRAWMSDHPPTEPHARFINLAHEDIRRATQNSQAWSDAKSAAEGQPAGLNLFWYPVDPNLHRGQANAAHAPARLPAAHA
jgi:hypothetical protein